MGRDRWWERGGVLVTLAGVAGGDGHQGHQGRVGGRCVGGVGPLVDAGPGAVVVVVAADLVDAAVVVDANIAFTTLCAGRGSTENRGDGVPLPVAIPKALGIAVS